MRSLYSQTLTAAHDTSLAQTARSSCKVLLSESKPCEANIWIPGDCSDTLTAVVECSVFFTASNAARPSALLVTRMMQAIGRPLVGHFNSAHCEISQSHVSKEQCTHHTLVEQAQVLELRGTPITAGLLRPAAPQSTRSAEFALFMFRQ